MNHGFRFTLHGLGVVARLILVCGVVVLLVAAGASARAAADRSGWIVFEAQSGLYVIGADGGQPRRIPGSKPGDGDPRWSPDGKQISFERKGEGNWDVFVMDADGSNPRQLTFSPADDFYAAWSPDGRSLVFQSERDGADTSSVYAFTLRTGAARRVTRDGKLPDWMSDRRIVFLGDGLGAQPLFTVRPWGADRQWREYESLAAHVVRVSDDGAALVYNWGTPTDIYTARSDGSGVRKITSTSTWEEQMAFSPDGRSLVFDSTANDLRGSPTDLYVAARDGENRVRLTTMKTACCPDWSVRASP